jgi:hypothetical protein
VTGVDDPFATGLYTLPEDEFEQNRFSASPSSPLLDGSAFQPYLAAHMHRFQGLLNPNHTVIRMCTSCGQTWVTLAAGNPAELVWHIVQEGEVPAY